MGDDNNETPCYAKVVVVKTASVVCLTKIERIFEKLKRLKSQKSHPERLCTCLVTMKCRASNSHYEFSPTIGAIYFSLTLILLCGNLNTRYHHGIDIIIFTRPGGTTSSKIFALLQITGASGNFSGSSRIMARASKLGLV